MIDDELFKMNCWSLTRSAILYSYLVGAIAVVVEDVSDTVVDVVIEVVVVMVVVVVVVIDGELPLK